MFFLIRVGILVQLRQRTVQYELIESYLYSTQMKWNNINEVASPRTGLFAPVSVALRRGWIKLGNQNEYMDPSTGISMPLETAYQKKYIKLYKTAFKSNALNSNSTPSLLLIKRTYYSWCKAYLISVLDTLTQEIFKPEIAIQKGLLETTDKEIRLLDKLNNNWITIEEGAGRQIIQLEPATPTQVSMTDEIAESVVCKVYHLSHVNPGGEPNLWLQTMDAFQLGLFNWSTGELAVNWPEKPFINTIKNQTNPTQWCNILTALQYGWLKLNKVVDPKNWIQTFGLNYQEPGSLLLSTEVNLLAPTNKSLSNI